MPTINYAQYFCSVSDLVADMKEPGVDEARMLQAIMEACDYLSKEIGWFIPVTFTRSYNGRGFRELIVAPLIAITTITNDGTSLVSTDYILKPDHGYWPNGPYGIIHVDPDAVNLGSWADELDGVVIAGRWGLYERSVVTGATVQDNPQSDSQTTLKVSDGGKISPGMVLYIGTEQELVTGWGAVTASVTTLNGAVAVADDYITLVNSTLVNLGEIVRVNLEDMKIRAINTTTHKAYVYRQWNGTARAAHTTSTAVDVYRTVNVDRGVNGSTAAAHVQAVAISRLIPPSDVQLLAKKVATLIINQAKSGYQGRTGNPELGVVFYHDIFVRDIMTIKQNYRLDVFA